MLAKGKEREKETARGRESGKEIGRREKMREGEGGRKERCCKLRFKLRELASSR